jgi:hypothetical protein
MQLVSAQEALMRKPIRPAWKFGYLVIALTAFGAVQSIAQQSTSNLSGIWRWNADKSHVSGRPANNRRVKIEQQGTDLTITTRVLSRVGEEFQKYHFTIGSDSNTNQWMGTSVKSNAQWKDGALTVDSVAGAGADAVHLSDKWTPSPDGKTLTFDETAVRGDRPPREDTIVYEKQQEADWEPPQPPKLAEDAFKNIQVFKGTPAPELMNAMHSFTRALGVKCDYCHVEGAFEKDDKPEKQTARKMILMARGIDKDNFEGDRAVTCWTCHRGSTDPETAPDK